LLDLPLQRCRVGYWLPWTSWSRNFRETFAKKTFCTSTNKSTPWIVVRGSAPLDYSIVLGSIPRLPISQSNSG
jgi:hypothetical protein